MTDFSVPEHHDRDSLQQSRRPRGRSEVSSITDVMVPMLMLAAAM